MSNEQPDHFACLTVTPEQIEANYHALHRHAPKAVKAYKGTILCVLVPKGEINQRLFEGFENSIVTIGDGGDVQPAKNYKLAEIKDRGGERHLHLAYYQASSAIIDALTSHSIINGARQEELLKELLIDSYRQSGKPPRIQ